MVEWADFQCPYCGMVAPQLKDLQARRPTELRVIFKHYPLSNECNPYVNHAMHQFACGAAVAGVCAQKQGKFWEYHDKSFANQGQLTVPDLKKRAEEMGLDMAKFNQCLDSGSTKDKIDKDVKEAGTRLGE